MKSKLLAFTLATTLAIPLAGAPTTSTSVVKQYPVQQKVFVVDGEEMIHNIVLKDGLTWVDGSFLQKIGFQYTEEDFAGPDICIRGASYGAIVHQHFFDDSYMVHDIATGGSYFLAKDYDMIYVGDTTGKNVPVTIMNGKAMFPIRPLLEMMYFQVQGIGDKIYITNQIHGHPVIDKNGNVVYNEKGFAEIKRGPLPPNLKAKYDVSNLSYTVTSDAKYLSFLINMYKEKDGATAINTFVKHMKSSLNWLEKYEVTYEGGAIIEEYKNYLINFYKEEISYFQSLPKKDKYGRPNYWLTQAIGDQLYKRFNRHSEKMSTYEEQCEAFVMDYFADQTCMEYCFE